MADIDETNEPSGRIPPGRKQKVELSITGENQTIPLPKNCHFDCKKVYIKKGRDGLTITPVKPKDVEWKEFTDCLDKFPDNYFKDGRQQLKTQERQFGNIDNTLDYVYPDGWDGTKSYWLMIDTPTILYDYCMKHPLGDEYILDLIRKDMKRMEENNE